MSIHEHGLDDSPKQRIVDDEHLRLLRIGYFVSAAMTGLMAVFGLFYGLIGVFVFSPFAHQVSAGGKEPFWECVRSWSSTGLRCLSCSTQPTVDTNAVLMISLSPSHICQIGGFQIF